MLSFATQSLFSVGATGTLVFGLASKDVASQVKINVYFVTLYLYVTPANHAFIYS